MSQRKAKNRTIGKRFVGYGRGMAAPERDPKDPGDTPAHVWEPEPCVVMQCRIGGLHSFLWVSAVAEGIRLSFSEAISSHIMALSPHEQSAVFDSIQEQAQHCLEQMR